MISMMESEPDLSPFAQSDGIFLICEPRQFAGGEEAYEDHVGDVFHEDRLRSGRGAWLLIQHYARRPIHSVLEIGSGGGACTLGLIAAARDVQALITDTSLTFLQMTRRKLVAAGLPLTHVRFATLAGEELTRLPLGSLDAMVIASALHHIADWRSFLKEAAALLRPGGVLVVQEPCREGNLIMGMALDMVLSPLWPQDLLDPADIERITLCRDSIYYLADSTLEKVGEDKHSFLVTELVAGADAAGFAGTAFHSNAHFADLTAADLNKRQNRCSLVEYLDSFLQLHHRVSTSGMAALRRHLFPVLQQIDARYRGGDGPALLGCMAFRR